MPMVRLGMGPSRSCHTEGSDPTQLLEIRANLAQLINHPNPPKIIVAQKEKLMMEIRRKEPQQQRGLPPDFMDKIDEF